MRIAIEIVLLGLAALLIVPALIEGVSKIPEYPDQQVVPIATSIANTRFSDPKDEITAAIALRQYQTDGEVKVWSLILQVVGAGALVIGALVTWRNYLVTRRTLEATEDRLGIDKKTLEATEARLELDRNAQLSNRFYQATAQLGAELQNGSPNIEVRLGAIDDLRQLAYDSPGHRHRVIGRLATYVRDNSPWRSSPSEAEDGNEANLAVIDSKQSWIANRRWVPRSDVQWALKGLGAITLDLDEGQTGPSLAGTDLRGADLSGGHFERADLSHAHLEDAFLEGVHFEEAQLVGGNLGRAFLQAAHFERAALTEARFDYAFAERANFDEAWLHGASLRRVNLDGAWLEGASLYNADLTGASLDGTYRRGGDFDGACGVRAGRFATDRSAGEQH